MSRACPAQIGGQQRYLTVAFGVAVDDERCNASGGKPSREKLPPSNVERNTGLSGSRKLATCGVSDLVLLLVMFF
jgi:hypothetical protein